jgi:oxaloacetate decarboxylase gamma subunit
VNAELLEQGLELMIAGMGTVFVFLTVLVFATTGMSALVRRFRPVTDTESIGVSEEEVAAITIAIARHRRKHSR